MQISLAATAVSLFAPDGEAVTAVGADGSASFVLEVEAAVDDAAFAGEPLSLPDVPGSIKPGKGIAMLGDGTVLEKLHAPPASDARVPAKESTIPVHAPPEDASVPGTLPPSTGTAAHDAPPAAAPAQPVAMVRAPVGDRSAPRSGQAPENVGKNFSDEQPVSNGGSELNDDLVRAEARRTARGNTPQNQPTAHPMDGTVRKRGELELKAPDVREGANPASPKIANLKPTQHPLAADRASAPGEDAPVPARVAPKSTDPNEPAHETHKNLPQSETPRPPASDRDERPSQPGPSVRLTKATASLTATSRDPETATLPQKTLPRSDVAIIYRPLTVPNDTAPAVPATNAPTTPSSDNGTARQSSSLGVTVRAETSVGTPEPPPRDRVEPKAPERTVAIPHSPPGATPSSASLAVAPPPVRIVTPELGPTQIEPKIQFDQDPGEVGNERLLIARTESADLVTRSAAADPRASLLPRATIAQISEAIRGLPEGTVELRLSPEELGRVRLTLAPGEAGMVVQMTAERGETLELLRRHADLLAADLRDAGYSGLDFSFQREGRDEKADALEMAPSGERAAQGADIAPQIARLRPATSAGSGGLDIRL